MKFRLVLRPEAEEEEIVAAVHQRSELTDEIERLVQADGSAEVLYGCREEEIRRLDTAEIESVYVMDGRTYAAYADGKEYRLKQRLYELEAKLPADFVRINKSALANRRKIRSFQTQISGAVDVVFLSGHRDYVSRRCFSELKRRYEL